MVEPAEAWHTSRIEAFVGSIRWSFLEHVVSMIGNLDRWLWHASVRVWSVSLGGDALLVH